MNQNGTVNEQHETPPPLPLRGPIPKPGIRLHKRNVFMLIGALALVLGYAAIDGLSTPKQDQPDALKNLRPANPGDAIKNLPSDYSAIRRKKIGPPLNGDFGEAQLKQRQKVDPTDIEKYLEELKFERLKRSVQARESDIAFAGLRPGEISKAGDSARGALQALGNLGSRGSALSGSSASSSPRDDDNRQDDKRSFLADERGEQPVLDARLLPPISEYQLMGGTLIPGLLLTGINSDLPGKLLAQVSQNVFDSATGKYLLIPQGSKLLGEYDSRISYGQERVLVVWTRIVFPNSSSISLDAMPGVDLSGYAGLTDKVNNHYRRLLSAVVFTSLLGATAQVSHGSNRLEQSFSDLAVEGFADNLNQAGQQITRKNLNIQPTLEVRPGYRVNVFVTKDIVLKPYTE